MHDEIRTIHVGEKVWKWELVDGVAFPHIKIRSPYGKKYIESADYFLNKNEKFLGYRINILPSMIKNYIINNIMKKHENLI